MDVKEKYSRNCAMPTARYIRSSKRRDKRPKKFLSKSGKQLDYNK